MLWLKRAGMAFGGLLIFSFGVLTVEMALREIRNVQPILGLVLLFFVFGAGAMVGGVILAVGAFVKSP